MASDDESYDQAREIVERALEAFAKGDDETGAKLIEEAKAINETAVRDVGDELEEDAASEHDPAKLKEQMAERLRKKSWLQ